jgi:hypothetical protein
VHTSNLRSEEFTLSIDDRPATIPDLFPGFDEHDRLGIVIRADHGAAGAGTLILAAVTAFYDRLRAGSDDFFAYADYFAFHVDRPRGSLRKLDVYPAHKEVVVAADAEEILRAINDRGVTRLLVADGPETAPDLHRETRYSAERRIRSALAYSPTGQTSGADVVVRGSAQSDAYIRAMLSSTGGQGGNGETADEQAAQSFRRLTIACALGLLVPPSG